MASKLLKIGFIGGGKMAQAMAKGFISAGTFNELQVQDIQGVSKNSELQPILEGVFI